MRLNGTALMGYIAPVRAPVSSMIFAHAISRVLVVRVASSNMETMTTARIVMEPKSVISTSGQAAILTTTMSLKKGAKNEM